MSKVSYKNAIKILPMFFDSRVEVDSTGGGIFDPLKKIIDFDESYIFFLNPDSITLRYLSATDSKFKPDDTFNIDEEIKNALFTTECVIVDQNHDIIEKLQLKNHKSFLILKLIVKNAIFGFILLCKKEKDYYDEDFIDIANTIASVISYKIKDIELSQVCKIQLQALKTVLVQSKDAYKTIKQQNLKIVESDKVKTEFLANVSHELRTPLNAIIGFSDMLSNKLFGDLNEKQAEYVHEISVSGIHLLGMINELLDISKIEAKAMKINKSEFEISRAIEEVINVVKPLALKKNIEIIKNITEDKIVYADFQKIRQILYNLLSNAIKFSPEDEEINVDVSFRNGELILKIKDKGVGIAPRYHQKIFEKFFQIENTYTKKESSTGLGLTITKELVQMHGGTISIKSLLNKGATFIIKLPCRS